MFLESVALFLLVTGLRAALTPRPKSPRPDDPHPPRSEEGVPVPVVFGSAMVAPNATAFIPLMQLAVATSGPDVPTYFPHAQLVLCHGPIDDIADMRFDDGQTRFSRSENRALFPFTPASGEYSRLLTIATDRCFGGNGAGGHVGGAMYVHAGRLGQPADSNMAATPGIAFAPAHDGICYVWLDGMEWGESPQMKAVRFHVRRYPWALYDAKVAAGGNPLIVSTAQIGTDANPAAIVYEILTNTRWGLGLPAAVIDLPAFLAAAETLADAELGLSFVLETQSDAESVIEDVCRHAYATLQQDPVTGLIRFDAHRDDDASEATIDTDSATFESVTRPSAHELPNYVWVRYQEAPTASSNSKTAAEPFPNEAAIQATGETRPETYDYLMASGRATARKIGTRVLPRATLPLARVRFTTDRRAAGWKIGTVVTATDADRGLSSTRLRITRIDWGTLESGRIECEALEEPIPGAAVVTVPDDGGTVPPGSSPFCTPYSGDELVIPPNADGWWNDKDDGWTIEEVVAADIPSGVNVHVGEGIVNVHPDTSLGYHGLNIGPYILFGGANAYGSARASRTLTGFQPFATYRIRLLASQFSSTHDPRDTMGANFGSWCVVGTPLLPAYKQATLVASYPTEVSGTTVTDEVVGYATADVNGEIYLAYFGEIKHSLANFTANWSLIGILDEHCDEDWEDPAWFDYEPVTVTNVEAHQLDDDTLRVTFDVNDPTGGSLPFPAQPFSWVAGSLYTAGAWAEQGVIPAASVLPFVLTGTSGTTNSYQWDIALPTDGSEAQWKLEVHSYDAEDVEAIAAAADGVNAIVGDAIVVGGDTSGTVGNQSVDKLKGVPMVGTLADGETWVKSGASLVPTDIATQAELDAVVAAGAPATRAAFTITTASLANAATETGSVSIATAFLLMGALTASRFCWLRLYGTAAARTADAARLRTEDPDAGVGVLFEAIFDTDSGLGLTVGPIPPIANEDTSPTDAIYYAITNDGTTGTVVITGRALRLEA